MKADGAPEAESKRGPSSALTSPVSSGSLAFRVGPSARLALVDNGQLPSPEVTAHVGDGRPQPSLQPALPSAMLSHPMAYSFFAVTGRRSQWCASGGDARGASCPPRAPLRSTDQIGV